MHVFERLTEILESADSPITVFFRNDDAGWANDRLQTLCECFRQADVPLDIAVIPAALNAESIRLLQSICLDSPDLFHLHQHGYAHTNHQAQGRSCEFGSDRALAAQLDDIARGQGILKDAFNESYEAIFTPPWNRCTSETKEALESLGFELLSRIKGSVAIAGSLPELPVSVDWLKKRKGVPLSPAQVIDLLCQEIDENSGPVGIMLHHEHMDERNREMLFRLIMLLKNSYRVRFVSMLEYYRPMPNSNPADMSS